MNASPTDGETIDNDDSDRRRESGDQVQPSDERETSEDEKASTDQRDSNEEPSRSDDEDSTDGSNADENDSSSGEGRNASNGSQTSGNEAASSGDSGSNNDSGNGGDNRAFEMPKLPAASGPLLKALVLLGCLGFVAYFLYRYGRDLLAMLRGETSQEIDDFVDRPQPSDRATPPRPFSSFRNPIGDNVDRGDAIVTTFAALEAFAREQGLRRGVEETPSEFAIRLRRGMPQLADDGTGVIDAYNRWAFGGNQRPTDADMRRAAALWRQMQRR